MTERAHVLDRVASWILASVADGPRPTAELVDEAVAATGTPEATVAADLAGGVATLRDLGLVDRPDPYVPPAPLVGSTRRATGWAEGAVHAVLDHGIAFRSPDRALLAEIDRFLAAAVDDRPADLRFDVEVEKDGGVTLTTDDEWRFPTRSAFYAQLPGVVNEYAARSHGLLVLHAGAVRTPDGRILLLPGHIDAGKSTLVAALVRSGCDYLGDESIGIRSGTLHAIGYPKPLTLDSTSRAVLGLPDDGEPHLGVDAIRADVERLGGAVGPIAAVVLTEYAGPRPTDPSPAGTETSVVHLSALEAAKALLGNVLNLARAGEPGLVALCELAEAVPTTRVTHGDSVELARRIVAGELSGGSGA